MCKCVKSNVLKTGPDRPVQPVQPLTGRISGPMHPIKPFSYWTGYEPPDPAVEPVNRTVLNEPNSPYWSVILQAHCIKK